MLCSVEPPDERTDTSLSPGLRHGILVVLLIVIVVLAIYFAAAFSEVALVLLEQTTG